MLRWKRSDKNLKKKESVSTKILTKFRCNNNFLCNSAWYINCIIKLIIPVQKCHFIVSHSDLWMTIFIQFPSFSPSFYFNLRHSFLAPCIKHEVNKMKGMTIFIYCHTSEMRENFIHYHSLSKSLSWLKVNRYEISWSN